MSDSTSRDFREIEIPVPWGHISGKIKQYTLIISYIFIRSIYSVIFLFLLTTNSPHVKGPILKHNQLKQCKLYLFKSVK